MVHEATFDIALVQRSNSNESEMDMLLHNTVASGNSVSPNSGNSCYNGYVQITDCLFQ